MTIDDIDEAVKARGLVRSERRFSQAFLGRAPNYAADTGLQGCSAAVLTTLYRRLGAAGQVDLQARALERLLAAEARSSGTLSVRP